MTNTAEQSATMHAPVTGKKTAVTVAYGDGIGPEIMTATMKVLKAAIISGPIPSP